MISGNWIVSSVGECCDVIRGVAFPSAAKALKSSEGSVACLRTANVQREVEWDSLWHIPRTYVRRDEQLIRESDILISLANSYELVGKVALIREVPCESTLGAFISAIRCYEYVLPKFVYYQLASTGKQTELRATASTTTNISNISTAKLSALALSVAPSKEQSRIVEKIDELFSDLDASVAALERARANLKRYRASVLKAAVEGRLTAEWRKTHPPAETATQLLERILAERRKKWEQAQLAKFAAAGKAPPKNWKDKYPEPTKPDTAKLPELPEGWCWMSVEEMSIVVRGASPRPAGDPRFFGGRDVPWITVGAITADESPYLDEVDEYLTTDGKEHSRYIEKETLLLTNSGATLGVPKITRIGGCINDGSVALLNVYYPLKLYLVYFFHTQTKMLRRINQGAAQPNLNTTIVKQILVPVPPSDEQEVILAEVERRLSIQKKAMDDVSYAEVRASRLRQSILKRAFEGKLVPQDPDDEPASVLLERILAARMDPNAGAARKSRKQTSRKGGG